MWEKIKRGGKALISGVGGFIYGVIKGAVDIVTFPIKACLAIWKSFKGSSGGTTILPMGGGSDGLGAAILIAALLFNPITLGLAVGLGIAAGLALTPVGHLIALSGVLAGGANGAATCAKEAYKTDSFVFKNPEHKTWGDFFWKKNSLLESAENFWSWVSSPFRSKSAAATAQPIVIPQNTAQNLSQPQTHSKTKMSKSRSHSQAPATPLVANSTSRTTQSQSRSHSQAPTTPLAANSTVNLHQKSNSSNSSRNKVQRLQNLNPAQAFLSIPTAPPPGLSYPCSKPTQIQQTLATFLNPITVTNPPPTVSPSNWSTPVTKRLTTFSSPDENNKAAAAWITQAATNKDKNNTGLSATLFIKTENSELDRLIIAKKLIDDLRATLDSTSGSKPNLNEPLVITISSSKIPAMDKAIIDYCAMMKKPPLICEIEKNGVTQEQKTSHSPKALAALKKQLDDKVAQIDSSYEAGQKDTATSRHTATPR